MNVLGLIPARAGSVRAPGKNTAKLGDFSLVEWAIIRAQQSGIFTNIVVSTNDQDVITECNGLDCPVIIRPDNLAQPDTPMLPVVRHALRVMVADVVVLLQPTSPFRTSDDIKAAYELLTENRADAIVSVTEPPEDLVFELGFAKRLRPAPMIVVPNGAIYIITKDHLVTMGDWYTGLVFAYEMPKERSLDVDTPLDLEIARVMHKKLGQAA